MMSLFHFLFKKRCAILKNGGKYTSGTLENYNMDRSFNNLCTSKNIIQAIKLHQNWFNVILFYFSTSKICVVEPHID